MYSSTESWQKWMKDFRFGTLVFIPSGGLRTAVEELRKKYDPESAVTSMPHVTLTQPFRSAPTNADVSAIQRIMLEFNAFDFAVGPATTSPNQKLLWLDINPKEMILTLRERLHQTDLFRTDLPLTKGFIPHMTISEQPRDTNDVQEIIAELNKSKLTSKTSFSSVTWTIPNEQFVFQEHRDFRLR